MWEMKIWTGNKAEEQEDYFSELVHQFSMYEE